MISAPEFGSKSLGSIPSQGHCVMFLSKTPHSHNACFNSKLSRRVLVNCWGNQTKYQSRGGGHGSSDVLTSHAGNGRVAIPLVTSSFYV